uniref:Uncharacterized protein LOC114329538 isoform X3 n=1 Tax=Diabrotica virgifera virgifera TaxID=50390 RepID=A0A6P7FN99_DIAVI
MKISTTLFLGLLFTAAVVSSFSFDDDFEKYLDECNSNDATRIDRDALDKAKRQEKFNPDQLSAYLNCIFTKFGIQDENGDYKQQRLNDFIKHVVSDQGNVETIITNCGTRPEGTTAKIAALHLLVCIRKYDKLRVR